LPNIVEAAAADNRVHMSGEGAVRRDSRYNTSVNIGLPKIEVIRE
jgi:hypothetical protein